MASEWNSFRYGFLPGPGPVGGSIPGGLRDGGDRVENREEPVEIGPLQDPLDLAARADERQVAVLLPQLVEQADEHAEAGGVDEVHRGEVDGEPGAVGRDRREHGTAQLVHRVEVQLTAQAQHRPLSRAGRVYGPRHHRALPVVSPWSRSMARLPRGRPKCT